MRLSEVRGERTLDVVAELIDPIANIASDEKVVGLIRHGDRKEVEDGLRQAAKLVLSTHKEDVIAILAAVEDVPQEEYSKSLNPYVLARSFLSMIGDEELVDFFQWFSGTETTPIG